MEAKWIQDLPVPEITRASAPEFWFEYQRAVLLALKELGLLDEKQCRSAEKFLREECSPVPGGGGHD